jgi:hypothetical protein
VLAPAARGEKNSGECGGALHPAQYQWTNAHT